MGKPNLSPYLLGALLTGAGASHFTHPTFYDRMVPRRLPGPARAWTWASGLAEVGVGAAVLRPRTRKRGALAATALFIAVFPGNLQMAADATGVQDRAVTYARLPMQVPLVRWAWRVFRKA